PLFCTNHALVCTSEPDKTNLKGRLSHLFIGFRAAIPVNKKAVPALIAPALLLSVYQIFIAQDLVKESKIKRGLRKLLVKIYKIETPSA
ncbi:hypothetical protein, partial [Porphyromonas sp. COT-108 OH2963]|uniref:hypothetical protein n=1 Tax=Porphyromonas sp. COT-108 OH2963 TaxID=1515614 RepID=UPI0005670D8E